MREIYLIRALLLILEMWEKDTDESPAVVGNGGVHEGWNGLLIAEPLFTERKGKEQICL